MLYLRSVFKNCAVEHPWYSLLGEEILFQSYSTILLQILPIKSCKMLSITRVAPIALAPCVGGAFAVAVRAHMARRHMQHVSKATAVGSSDYDADWVSLKRRCENKSYVNIHATDWGCILNYLLLFMWIYAPNSSPVPHVDCLYIINMRCIGEV